MSKIVLPPVTGADNLSTLNSNFSKIEEALNDKTLYRDNPVGQPNQMVSELDMNGKRIYNLPKPILPSEPARLADIGTGGGGGGATSADNVSINTIPGLSATQVQAALEEINAKPDSVFDPQSLRVPESTVAVLPNAATRANKVLGFNGSGVPVAVSLSADDASVLRLDLATPDATKGSDLVSFVNTLGGDRSVTDKLKDVLSVKDFGAIGDGVVNDTVAVQAALNFAAANNRSLFFPKGTYIATGLTFTATYLAHLTIFGEGSGNTFIKAPAGSSSTLFKLGVGGVALGPNQVSFSGITFQGNYPNTYQADSSAYTSEAFYLDTANHILFDDCRFIRARTGCRSSNGVIVHFHQSSAWYNEIGFYIATPGATNAATTNFFDKSDAKSNYHWGVYFDDGRMTAFHLCTVEANGGFGAGNTGGVFVGQSTGKEGGAGFLSFGLLMNYCWFENNSGTGGTLQLQSGVNTLTNCIFSNSPTDPIINIEGGQYHFDNLLFENPKTNHIVEAISANVLSGNTINNCYVGGITKAPANAFFDAVKTRRDYASTGGGSNVVGNNVGTGAGLLYKGFRDELGTRFLDTKTVFASTGISVTNTAETVNIAVVPATASVIGGVKPGAGLSVDAFGVLSATGGGGGAGAWQSASLQAGWSVYTTADPRGLRYRLNGDVVELSGCIQYSSGTIPNISCATLPVGFRPTVGYKAQSIAAGGGTIGAVVIDNTGRIDINATNAIVFLDGVRFPIT